MVIGLGWCGFSTKTVTGMRGFDPIARGMKRSDLTPMKVREYRGLLLNSSENFVLYATRIPNTAIGIDHFDTRTWPTHRF